MKIFRIHDLVCACLLVSAIFTCIWFATESVRTMTLVCVKVVSDRDGLAQALEQCK